MNVLYVGSFLPEEYGTKIEYLSLAGNRYQNTFLEELKLQYEYVKELSFIGFPVEDQYVEEVQKIPYAIYHPNKLTAVRQFRTRLRQVCKWADVVICYNVAYPWFGLQKLAKKYDFKTVLLLADYSDQTSFTSKIHKIKSNLELRELQKYDLLVGLSENTKRFCGKNQKFICIEGGVKWQDYADIPEPNYEENHPLTIMYSGLLSQVTGVDLLLQVIDRFEKSDKYGNKIRWMISGKGPMIDEVAEFAEKHADVEYIGSVPYEQYVNYLTRAHIYVNPRNMHLPENQNNFPSKMIEYLAMGRVIVSTKFAGWEKFQENAYYCETKTDDIYRQVENALNKYDDVYQQTFVINRNRAREFSWNANVKTIIGELELN